MPTLIFKKETGKIGVIKLDATLNEDHAFTSEIPQYPVESGADVSDHIIPKPRMVSMRGFVTNSPIVNIEASNAYKVGSAINELRNIYNNRELITVVTGLEVYSDVAMESLSIPVDGQTGQALIFNATFKKVRFVTASTVIIPNVKPIVERTAASTANTGNQQTEDIGDVENPDAEGPKEKSWLAKVIDRFNQHETDKLTPKGIGT